MPFSISSLWISQKAYQVQEIHSDVSAYGRSLKTRLAGLRILPVMPGKPTYC